MFMIPYVDAGHSFIITRFTKESLNLPLFLPVPDTQLIFSPTPHPDESSLGPDDPKPHVQLIRDGHITNSDMRYRSLISIGRNGSIDEVVIVRLTLRHDGVYEIRDRDGNLVSSTTLQVIGESVCFCVCCCLFVFFPPNI